MASLHDASSTASQAAKGDLRFEVRQYAHGDREQVLQLISNGMRGFAPPGHPHHNFWAGYVENKLSDIADIPAHYLTSGSHFFVATATNTNVSEAETVIVGTTAVERKSDSVAELRRVSVKAEFRRFGIGRMLLNHIHEWAKNDESKPKYEKVVVSTASSYRHAVKFYESLGYEFTKTSVWTTDPFIELSHFEKCL